jgi:hypothetical protein
MAQKSLGFIKLIWDCPSCGTVNPGPFAFCSGCGAPMPPETQFRKTDHDVFVQDETEINRAKAGADKFCGYCGSRNPAAGSACVSCGGDLSPANARETGKVLGALNKDTPDGRPCPACGTVNPVTTLKCTQCSAPLQISTPKEAESQPSIKKTTPLAFIIAAVLTIIVLCGGIYMLFIRTEDVKGTVTARQWETQIGILEYMPNKVSDWRSELPKDAEIIGCKSKVRSESGENVPGSNEVCGTPYTKDMGNGYAEVVQDCVYQVMEEMCEYNRYEWKEASALTLSGGEPPVKWPPVALAVDQKQGDSRATYKVFFDVDGEKYTYTLSDQEEWAGYKVGSQWVLAVNKAGGVSDVDPLR